MTRDSASTKVIPTQYPDTERCRLEVRRHTQNGSKASMKAKSLRSEDMESPLLGIVRSNSDASKQQVRAPGQQVRL